MEGKKIYFLSDAHLGATVLPDNRDREKKLVHFLQSIREECEALYLLGDMFDFWFEYKRSIPKGFVRFLGELARFTDDGIPVHFFTGNHDIWAFDYLARECGVSLHFENELFTLHGKRFMIGHGDGLNPLDKKYLKLKRLFNNRFLQSCFRLIHPDLGIKLANSWSSHSRLKDNGKIEADDYRGEEREGIVVYCKKELEVQHIDYFIFGHRHLPLNIPLTGNSRYINTGDWISHYSYAVFDGNSVELMSLYP